ncbi:MAG: mechanosensitive ion channel family protein, partial [Planctomycetota bacterium]
TAAAVILLANWIMLRRSALLGSDAGFRRQIILLVLTAVGVIAVLLTLPIEDPGTRNQLLALVGLAFTAVVALSSTTFVANAMAGIMLRSVGSFRPGDFLQVDGQLGRVTERGLFHTEIQTRERNLTTLPNLYLVGRPFTVIRSSGTIVSATVSLGYDVSRKRIEPLLVQAAESAGLTDPFAQVQDLGDFAVTYRVAGFLDEVKQLLTIRSKLRRSMLDTLHRGGVEIASPSIMIQRPLPDGKLLIPRRDLREREEEIYAEDGHEARVFDKAELAQKSEDCRAKLAELKTEIKELESSLAKAEAEDRPGIESEISLRKRQADYHEKTLERLANRR